MRCAQSDIIGDMRRMLRARRLVAPCTVIAATAFLVSGCNAKTFARDQFGSRYTCPDERITTTLRKDLSAVDLAFRCAVAGTRSSSSVVS